MENASAKISGKLVFHYIVKVLCDIFGVVAASVFVFLLNGKLTDTQLLLRWCLANTAICLIVFGVSSGYRFIYAHFGFVDGLRLAAQIVFSIVLEYGLWAILLINRLDVLTVTFYCLTFAVVVSVIRCTPRALVAFKRFRFHYKDKRNVIIIGGGAAGVTVIKDLQATDKVNLHPVAVLDDNPEKKGLELSGVPIVGTVDDVKAVAEKYGAKEIIVAIPSASKSTLRNIVDKCHLPDVKIRILPSLYQMASGEVSVGQIRNVEVQDLLGRDQVQFNSEEIRGYISGKVVMVTGGGGSIGSELCRQIARMEPKQLIIFDIYENNAYEIEQELKNDLPFLPLLTLIGSVRDMGKLRKVFETYHPQIVFNAAAHKHVPLMETSPNEAVKNNVFGTLNMAKCADEYGVERFVQISTDKAVNPTNVMGATKRICEMIIQTIGRHSKTEFVAVRFGNVLGSNGSVIPLFKKQIAAGGPVKVTDPDIVRYFMTIPEAVSLVLQAGAYAKGGEIYVLDMGEQVKIYDLACNLIRLSGYEVGKDIQIEFTGLRPGEKLYEERLMDEEGMKKTANKSISIGKPLDIDEENLFAKLDVLYRAAYEETDKMKELVHELVPTYRIDKREE
ncbi:MAG: polysaccharide biosynthesis protein [Clostridia bacterium]|nr:polysaccharide biosynthesis protein [Clostridia bacterium]